MEYSLSDNLTFFTSKVKITLSCLRGDTHD